MPVTADFAADLALAFRLADTARDISMAAFRGRFKSRAKADGSLVTEVDEAVEDALRALVKTERPRDAFLGEERGQEGNGPRRWIVDAIDGTLSFADGTEGWGTLIALELDGRVVVGVCEMSPIAARYWASAGGGAFRTRDGSTPERLRVSAAGTLGQARSFVPPDRWLITDAARAQAAAVANVSRPYAHAHVDHPALKVAEGSSDLAVFFLAGPWDLAAPAIVVEEAGGRFTDIAGGAGLLNGAVFSNGRVHAAALDVLAAARAAAGASR
jgi:histidinol-phosphatase